MSGSKPRLTPQQVVEMRERFKEGASRLELAGVYGVSETTIRNYLFCVHDDPAIARVSPHKLYAPTGRRPALSRDCCERLRQMASSGESLAQLARMFGVTPKTVANYVNGRQKTRPLAA